MFPSLISYMNKIPPLWSEWKMYYASNFFHLDCSATQWRDLFPVDYMHSYSIGSVYNIEQDSSTMVEMENGIKLIQ